MYFVPHKHLRTS